MILPLILRYYLLSDPTEGMSSGPTSGQYPHSQRRITRIVKRICGLAIRSHKDPCQLLPCSTTTRARLGTPRSSNKSACPQRNGRVLNECENLWDAPQARGLEVQVRVENVKISRLAFYVYAAFA